MKKFEKLIKRIINRLNINLFDIGFDAEPYVHGLVSLKQLLKFYTFYGITSHHPLHFHFSGSNLAGSYFLGKCRVDGLVKRQKTPVYWKNFENA